MDILLSIIGTVITVISFVFALYINGQNVKLKSYNKEQAWDNYNLSSEVLAVLQSMNKIKMNNPELKGMITKGEAEARTLAKNQIKMIKRFEKRFDEDTINMWARKGKLHSGTQHVETFKNYID